MNDEMRKIATSPMMHWEQEAECSGGRDRPGRTDTKFVIGEEEDGQNYSYNCNNENESIDNNCGESEPLCPGDESHKSRMVLKQGPKKWNEPVTKLSQRRRAEYVYTRRNIDSMKYSNHRLRRRSVHETMIMKEKASRTIPEKVEKLFYSLGLFSSSHPVIVIFFATSLVLLACYPLLSYPLHGNKPQQFALKQSDFDRYRNQGFESSVYPRWLNGPPVAYVLQIIVKSAVLPWKSHFTSSDAVRGPLSQVFTVLNKIRDANMSTSLNDICLKVENVKSEILKQKIFMSSENDCLILSPADLWERRYSKFQEDPDVISTVLDYQSKQKGKSGLSEILLGMNVKDSGIRKHISKSRHRVISYAITMLLRNYNDRFIKTLKEELQAEFSTPKTHFLGDRNSSRPEYDPLDKVVNIYYPSRSSLLELVPLILTYIVMCLYLYFSIKKVDMFYSKIGVTFSALATVVASLCMSVGLCLLFGIVIEISAKQIFPYLVVIVGLENMLVLTRSVVSTSAQLDVKIRVAKGLSKEGWGITTNLLTEMTILTIGFFTFVPRIQEFCILAIVGLCSDFFLQIFFFTPVISWDMGRIKQTSLETQSVPFRTPLHPVNYMKRHYNRSNDGYNSLTRSGSSVSIVAPSQSAPILVKIPKRLKLVYFWAKIRFFQRMFTVFMIGWISFIVYESGIVARFEHDTDHVVGILTNEELTGNLFGINSTGKRINEKNYFSNNSIFELMSGRTPNDTASDMTLHDLYVQNQYLWTRLPSNHWQLLFGVYNVSLFERYISILPSICIGIPVSDSLALSMRHPMSPKDTFTMDQSYFLNLEEEYSSSHKSIPSIIKSEDVIVFPYSDDEDPYIPNSPVELALTMLLAIPSVIFVAYMFVMLYRCICSRNYAEWRSNLANGPSYVQDPFSQVVFEALPLVLDGHIQEVECIGCNRAYAVSVSLAGDLKVWDASSGENLMSVNRKSYFENQNGGGNKSQEMEDILQSQTDSDNAQASKRAVKRSPSDSEREMNDGNIFKGYSGHRRYGSAGSAELNKISKSPQLAYQQSPVNSCSSLEYPSDCLDVASPVWCLGCNENVIVLGTKSGAMEIWDAFSGELRYVHEDANSSAIVCIKMIGTRVICARLNGSLDFFDVEYIHGSPDSPPAPYLRSGGNENHFSYGGALNRGHKLEQSIRCVWIASEKAHQQPITCLECEGGRILTGSQDHTLKVYNLEDNRALYTLHGHYGPITCLFIDDITPLTSGSGSHDGMLCVWDLYTGMCMYSIQAHDGNLNALTYSTSYIISIGSDEKICVWERFQGHLLNTIHLDGSYCSSLIMLTHDLLITSKQGSLIVWDVKSGEPVRNVRLGHRDNSIFVRQIIACSDAILCDYGSQLRLVRFPSISRKAD